MRIVLGLLTLSVACLLFRSLEATKGKPRVRIADRPTDKRGTSRVRIAHRPTDGKGAAAKAVDGPSTKKETSATSSKGDSRKDTEGWMAQLDLFTQKLKESAHAYLQDVRISKNATQDAKATLEKIIREHADIAKAKASSFFETARRRAKTCDQARVALQKWTTQVSEGLTEGIRKFAAEKGLNKPQRVIMEGLATGFTEKFKVGLDLLMKKTKELRERGVGNLRTDLINAMHERSQAMMNHVRGLKAAERAAQLVPLMNSLFDVFKPVARLAQGKSTIGIGAKEGKAVSIYVDDLKKLKGEKVVETLRGFESPETGTLYERDSMPAKTKNFTATGFSSKKGHKVMIIKVDGVTDGFRAYPLQEIEKLSVLSLRDAIKVAREAEKSSTASPGGDEEARALFTSELSKNDFCSSIPTEDSVLRLKLSLKEALSLYSGSFLKAALRFVESRPICKTPIPLFVYYFGKKDLNDTFNFGSISIAKLTLSHLKSFYASRSREEIELSQIIIEYIQSSQDDLVSQALYQVMLESPELRVFNRDLIDRLMLNLIRLNRRMGVIAKYLASTGRFHGVERTLVESRLRTNIDSVNTDILQRLSDDQTGQYEEDLAIVIKREDVISPIFKVLDLDGNIDKALVVYYFKEFLRPMLGVPQRGIVENYFTFATDEEVYSNFVRYLTKAVTDPAFIVQIEQLLCQVPNIARFVSLHLAKDKRYPILKGIMPYEWPNGLCSEQKTLRDCFHHICVWAKRKQVDTVYTPSKTRHPILGECRAADFEKVSTLGSGGFATVVLATHKKKGGNHALKKIKVSAVVNNPSFVKAEEVLSNKASSCHVVPVRCVAQTSAGGVRFVMDYFPNGSLASKSHGGHKFSHEEIRQIAVQMIEGLMAIHRAGVAHLDIKLENTLIDGKGNVAIADFGLAKEIKPGEIKNDLPGGTKVYMAPESALAGSYSQSSDFWSLAVALYVLKMRAFPYSYGGPTWSSVMLKKKAFPSTKDQGLDEVIRILTIHDPQKRAEAVQTKLRHLPYFKGVKWSKQDPSKTPSGK